MARQKKRSRTPAGEYMFTNPRKAAQFIRGLMKQGSQVYGTRSAMSRVGIQPHHYTDDKPMPDAEASTLAEQTDLVAGPVPISYAPTPSSNPQDPRTAAAGYDPSLQRLRVEWGDGGAAYNYYDVPPQIWDAFQRTDSPGKFINSTLNNYNYGRADEDS